MAAEPRGNTTISLVVVNRQLQPAQLQRLVAQVHTSMARAVQPFATEFDGDVLYPVSTGELDTPANGFEAVQIDVLASEVMWDAVLASIPDQPPAALPPASGPGPKADDLRRYVGEYSFSRAVCLGIASDGSQLMAQAVGAQPVYAIGRTAATVSGGRAVGVPGAGPVPAVAAIRRRWLGRRQSGPLAADRGAEAVVRVGGPGRNEVTRRRAPRRKPGPVAGVQARA